ncbi:response regulator [Beijerinckia sp. L45]|uniref:response regulator n=1 Tax=Beijerinckia sp. L45 TaxID=1641855 RepID=UPI00131ADA1E|nr:response regulator [Beijerinckia sp. L45]
MSHLEILLVDDDPLIRHVIADELEEAGHFVTPAVGGEAALELLRDGGPFDLILVDYTMPGMSGGELARRVLAMMPDMKMAILTGHSELPPGEEPPPCPIITKGVRMSEMIKAVEAAAAGEPLKLAHNATATRLDLLVDQMTTAPAVGGVTSAMHATYDAQKEEALPDAFSSVLDRMPGK